MTLPKHKLVAVLLCLLSLAVLPARAETVVNCESGSPTSTIGDAGNKQDKALALALPAVCTGNLTENIADPTKSDDADWYSVTLSRGQRFNLQVLPVPQLFATGITLLEPAPTEKDPNATADVTDSFCQDFARQPDTCDILQASIAGKWFFAVTRELGSGNYAMTAATTPAQNDCGIGGDAPAKPDQAPRLSNPTGPSVGTREIVCQGTFDGNPSDTVNTDFEDMYAVFVPQGETIFVALTATPNTPAVATVANFYDPNGEAIAASAPFSVLTTSTGWWVVDVTGQVPVGASGQQQYSIDISMIQHDCSEDPVDASAETPRKIDPVCTGQLDGRTTQPDTEDVYTFGSAPGALFATLTTSSGLCATVASPVGTSSPACGTSVVLPMSSNGSADQRVTVKLSDTTHIIGAYALAIAGTSPPEADCGPAGDSTVGAPRPITLAPTLTDMNILEGSCVGVIHDASDVDPFTFTAKTDEAIRATITDGFSACVIPVVNPKNAPCHALPYKVEPGITTSNDWLLNIGAGPATGLYNVKIDITMGNDCSTGIDAPDTQAGATLGAPIPDLILCSAKLTAAQPDIALLAGGGSFVDEMDDEDWFKLKIPGPISALSALVISGDVTGLEPNIGAIMGVCIVPPSSAHKAPACSQDYSALPTHGAGLASLAVATACDIPPRLGTVQVCHGNDDGQDTGTWYVQVKHLGGYRGSYRLLIAGTP